MRAVERFDFAEKIESSSALRTLAPASRALQQLLSLDGSHWRTLYQGSLTIAQIIWFPAMRTSLVAGALYIRTDTRRVVVRPPGRSSTVRNPLVPVLAVGGGLGLAYLGIALRTRARQCGKKTSAPVVVLVSSRGKSERALLSYVVSGALLPVEKDYVADPTLRLKARFRRCGLPQGFQALEKPWSELGRNSDGHALAVVSERIWMAEMRTRTPQAFARRFSDRYNTFCPLPHALRLQRSAS